MPPTRPERLHFTGDDDADAFIAEHPLALLVGFVLDQQVPVQKAFSSPLELARRLGRLDAAAVASAEPEELERVFRRKPALHRFPGAMARRVQELCGALVDEYGGDAERVWCDVPDARELERRLLALPGIGEMKAKTLLAVLGNRFGVRPPGWEEVAPRHPTLGDVDSPAGLAAYQAQKRSERRRYARRPRPRSGGLAASAPSGDDPASVASHQEEVHVPYHFGIFSTRTPEEWKGVAPQDRIARSLEIVAETDSELVGMWFDRDEDTGYVLLAGPNDPQSAQETLRKLGCDKGTKVLLTPAEKRSGR